jgi:hypothetical protein
MTQQARSLRPITVACAASLFLLPFALTLASQDSSQQSPLPHLEQQHTSSEEEAWEVQQKKAMAKQYNLQRQQDIKKDTDKLLELATELKQSVDKSSENTLSLDVIKKAEQIEKLAKTVKEKMKGP